MTGPNLYRLWVSGESLRRWLTDGTRLGREELRDVAEWGAAQAEWGWSVRLREGASGGVQAVEIAGAEGNPPEWIVYPTGDGFQADGFDGESHWSPTLRGALRAIAPAI